jgi:phage terminase small subunit
MGVPKRLTEMQKRFAEYLVFNEGRTTGADAAIAAGYSEKRARVEASELQKPNTISTCCTIHRFSTRRKT